MLGMFQYVGHRDEIVGGQFLPALFQSAVSNFDSIMRLAPFGARFVVFEAFRVKPRALQQTRKQAGGRTDIQAASAGDELQHPVAIPCELGAESLLRASIFTKVGMIIALIEACNFSGCRRRRTE